MGEGSQCGQVSRGVAESSQSSPTSYSQAAATQARTLNQAITQREDSPVLFPVGVASSVSLAWASFSAWPLPTLPVPAGITSGLVCGERLLASP